MDRRTLGEKNFRQKFEDMGFAERFEFVSRDWESYHGNKIVVVCKACGSQFSTCSEVLKGKQKCLYCKNCGASSDGGIGIKARNPKVDEAMQYYADGHSVKETAMKYGFTEIDINNWAKKRKVSNGRSFRDAANEERKKIAEENIEKRLLEHGFKYIGGYSGKGSRISFRCNICQTEYNRKVEKSTDVNYECVECKKRITKERAEEKKREKKAREETKRIEKEIYSLWHPVISHHEKSLDINGICEVCGKPYTLREYAESCGLKLASNNGVCSKECKDLKNRLHRRTNKKKYGKTDGHRHRAKKYGCEYDSSITLKKLIERDGLQCKLCGGMCKLDDNSWTDYSGPLYPSIDHIIPMSKGGGHVWGNVQIAHIVCNSKKGANAEEVEA